VGLKPRDVRVLRAQRKVPQSREPLGESCDRRKEKSTDAPAELSVRLNWIGTMPCGRGGGVGLTRARAERRRID
jgi:hypothetical protein